MKMRKLIGITALSFLLLASAAASAQEIGVHRACASEMQQRCGGVQPGEGRLRACVQQNFASFSEPCKKALLSTVAVVKACRSEVRKTCADVQPGAGRIQACMKDHFAEYSEPCKQAIVTAKLGRR